MSKCKPCEEAIIKIAREKLCRKFNLTEDECKELVGIMIKGIIQGKKKEEIIGEAKKFIQEKKGIQQS